MDGKLVPAAVESSGGRKTEGVCPESRVRPNNVLVSRSHRRVCEVDVGVEASQDVAVLDRLEVLGVELLTEWDALVFLHHHAASLCTAAQIAHLIGYDRAEIGPALHRLETLGLIQRSRVSQGIRFYRFSEPEEPERQSSLLELMNLTHNRAGRLMLLKHLKRSGLAPQRRPYGGLRLA
jgi:hypothetical protein